MGVTQSLIPRKCNVKEKEKLLILVVNPIVVT